MRNDDRYAMADFTESHNTLRRYEVRTYVYKG
jgi:hypothetical protein